MEQEKINELITENMKKIFLFCLSRVSSTVEAEDLAGDIFVELLRSYKNIRDEKCFYGFMWGVAHNVYKQYLRKRVEHVSYEEISMGIIVPFYEDDLYDKEELVYLRRELSILSEKHRECMVHYYIKNKSCSEISCDLNISSEMVKYYLFQARKYIKEGMLMSREYGEKSYNPSTFCINYWGSGANFSYWKLFERRLPGNILLACYYEPQSIADLSMELGVSAPYLEDELSILLKHNIIKEFRNGKYQTDIVIFTHEYERECKNTTKAYYPELAVKLNNYICSMEEEIRSIGFYGCDFDKNRLWWFISILSLLHSYNLSTREAKFPLLSDGSYGYVYGYNYDSSHNKFKGIDRADTLRIEETPRFTIVNYSILNNQKSWDWHSIFYSTIMQVIQNEEPSDLEAAAELIRGGFLLSRGDGIKPDFPVLTVNEFRRLLKLIEPITLELAEQIIKISEINTKILLSHAPKSLKQTCLDLGRFSNGLASMAYIIETMCEQRFIFVPHQTEIVSSYGIVEG